MKKEKTKVVKDKNTIKQVNKMTVRILKVYLIMVYVFIVLFLMTFILQTANSVNTIQMSTEEASNYADYKSVKSYSIDNNKVTLTFPDSTTEEVGDAKVRGITLSGETCRYVSETNTIYVEMKEDAGIEYVFRANNIAVLLLLCITGIAMHLFERKGVKLSKGFTVTNFILTLTAIVLYLTAVIVLNK